MKENKVIEEAGAIVIRTNSTTKEPEILLIFSKKEPKVRIFPKGHLKKGESFADAAARELMEESGIKGRITKEAGTLEYEFRNKSYRVTYFLFDYLEKVNNGEAGRDPKWFFWKDALSLLPFKELSNLLEKVMLEKIKS